MSYALVLLAAGKGTRMESDLPKVLHPLAQAPLLSHAITSGNALEPDRTIVVVGHQGEKVAEAAREIDPDILIAEQFEQLGTGHAVLAAKEALDGFSGDVVVLFGDTPFIRPETLQRMTEVRQSGADLVCLGFKALNPGRYGRLITEGDQLKRIVEFKDASEQERLIELCNSGVLMGESSRLIELLEQVQPSQTTGEIYLTDLPDLLTKSGRKASFVLCDEAETLGIDSRKDLAAAETVFQAKARAAALENGVLMGAPETVIFAQDTMVGRDAVIEPYVVFGPGVTIENNAQIRAFSHLEGAHVSEGAVVGPYARLRPGAELAANAKVGNFVEIKNANIDVGAKVNHLSYVGDASVGTGSNIGAGTITCNYDGVMKHHTEIGRNVFVGSNSMLVAPVSIGDDSMTATGSVITRDVPSGAMSIARARQENKPGMAVKLFERLRAIKARKKGS